MIGARTHPSAARLRYRELVWTDRGTSGPELMVTIAITVMVLSVGMLGLNQKFIDTSVMAQSVANDVRMARVNAVTRGAHYRVTLGSDWYRTERLQDNNNDRVWDPDTSTPAQLRQMKGGVTLTAATGTQTGGASTLEFDTRGMVVAGAGGTVPSMMTVAITGSTDARAERGTSYLYIWPSGQVQLLHAGEAPP